LPIYYKEVSFAVVDGVSTLVKVYGPLHPLYLVYLFGYFFAMVGVIVCARVKKTIASTSSAVIVAIAVFVNICVWFAEQLVAFDFEMLSVSYIISELFLLGAHLVMNENSRLQEIVKKVETAQSYPEREEVASEDMLYKPIEEDCVTPDRIEAFVKGLGQLTPTERRVFEAYVARVTTKELLSSMDIKESTLKFHNRNLYGKLGVSNRKELLELHKHVKHTKILLEEKGKAPLDKDP
jgi:DNA-binding CsgD family transcriptional regulator